MYIFLFCRPLYVQAFLVFNAFIPFSLPEDALVINHSFQSICLSTSLSLGLSLIVYLSDSSLFIFDCYMKIKNLVCKKKRGIDFAFFLGASHFNFATLCQRNIVLPNSLQKPHVPKQSWNLPVARNGKLSKIPQKILGLLLLVSASVYKSTNQAMLWINQFHEHLCYWPPGNCLNATSVSIKNNGQQVLDIDLITIDDGYVS